MDIPFGKHREFHEQFNGYVLSKEYFGKKRITRSVKHFTYLGETFYPL
jgi:hypothetical protein